MLKWIIIIALIGLLGWGLYFFPALTIKILGVITKVVVTATFGLVKIISSGISTLRKKFKDYRNRKVKKISDKSSDCSPNSISPNVTNVTNVNISGSRNFLDDSEIPSDIDTRVDESNLIKKDNLLTR